MADYTFHSLVEIAKNNSTIQTVLDVDALAAPAKTAVVGYVASLGLPAAETQHLLWENIGAAVMVDSLSITYYLPSLGSQTPAPALKRTSTLQDKVIEMQALESKFPKCQMLIFGRTSAASNWVWLNTEVIQNSGNRVNTLKLLPYLNQKDTFVPGRGTQIGIQFIADPVSNATLPQAQDKLTVHGSIALDVNPMGADSKKNDDLDQFQSRLAALETLLQPFGAATATAAGTTGLVEGAAAGKFEFLLRGDRQWQDPLAFVKAVGEGVIDGLKTFTQILTGNSFVRSVGAGDASSLSQQSQALIYSKDNASFVALVSASAPTNAKIAHIGLTAQGFLNVKRLNDTYTADVSTLMSFDLANNLQLSNFTNLGGNVSIKIFLVSGTTPSTQGSTLSIPLGIDSAKVVGILPFVFHTSSGRIPPSFKLAAGSEYECHADAGSIFFRLHPTNSSAIINKSCSALIFYTN